MELMTPTPPASIAYRDMVSEAEHAIARLTGLLARLCGAPVVTVMLLENDRTWYRLGPAIPGLAEPLAILLADQTLHDKRALIIADLHALASLPPSVDTQTPDNYRFYAGVPLMTAAGQALGTLSVWDHAPRELTVLQRDTLHCFAEQVATQLALVSERVTLANSQQKIATLNSSLTWQKSDLREAHGVAGLGSMEWQLDKGYLLLSQEACEIYDCAQGSFEHSLDCYMATVHPDDRGRLRAALTEATRGQNPLDIIHRIVCPDQSIRYVHERAQYRYDPQRRMRSLRGSVQDVTVQQARELALTQSKAQLAALFDQTYLFQVLLDAEGAILDVNQASMVLCGYQRQQALGKKFWDGPWWSPDAHIVSTIRAAVERCQYGQVVSASSDYLTGDGVRRQAEFTLSVIRDDAGGVSCLLASGMDVTERQRLEAFRVGQSAILEAVAAGAPIRDIMTHSVKLAASKTAGVIASIFLLDESGQHLLHGTSSGLPAGFVVATEGLQIGPHVGSCGTAVFERREVLVDDIAHDRHWQDYRALAEVHDLRACWSVPFVSGDDKVLGTFSMYANQARAPQQFELDMIRSSANILRIAIERDRVSQALQRSQAMLGATFAAADIGIAITDSRGHFLIANGAYCDMFGVPMAQLVNLNYCALLPDEAVADYRQQIERLSANDHRSFITEYDYCGKENATCAIRASVSGVINSDGTLGQILVIAEDLTSQKLAAAAYQQSQELLRIAGHAIHLGGWSLSVPGLALTWSAETAEIHHEPLGFTPTLEAAMAYYAPAYRTEMTTAVERCMRLGESFAEEAEIITATGRHIWVRSVGQAVRSARGEIVSIQGGVIDLSERRQAEQDRFQSLARIQNIASHLPGIIFEYRLNPDGTSCIPYISDAIKTYFRLDPDDVRRDASPIFRHVHPDDAPMFFASVQASADHLTPWRHEYRARFEDGQTIWLRANAMPRKEADGAIIWHGFVTDISDYRQSQEHLKLLETCIAHLNDFVIITEAEPTSVPGPRIVFVNEAFVRRTGFSAEEAIGQSPRLLQGPNTQRAVLDRIHTALENWEPVRGELINYTKSGEEIWMELDIVPVADEKGWYTHWIAVERDITERKKAEFELARLNRALLMRSAISAAIGSGTDETAMLETACRIVVEVGGYQTAWVGFARHDEAKTVEPVVAFGAARGYLEEVNISWDTERAAGRGSSGMTIKTGEPVVVMHLGAEMPHWPYIEQARQYGVEGVVSLPLKECGRCFGLFAFFMQEPRQITEEEIQLLSGLADDLAFAISSLRARAVERRSRVAILGLAESAASASGGMFYEQLIGSMAHAFGADGVFISGWNPQRPQLAKTIAAFADGAMIDNFDYLIDQAPCNMLLDQDEYLVLQDVMLAYADCAQLRDFGAQAYIGRRLSSATGEVLGFLVLLFRQPQQQQEFVSSILKVFAIRIAAELQRQQDDAHLLQQASLLDKAQDAIIVFSLDKKIKFWNQGAQRVYGWTAAQAQSDVARDLLLHDPTGVIAQAFTRLLADGEWHGELPQFCKDGRQITVEGRWTLVHDAMGQPESILAINTDISDRKAAEQAVQQLAFYDPLTQLPNRLLLRERMQQQFALPPGPSRTAALLFIDMDNFKTLNDSLGHSFGDQLLKQVALRLCATVRSGDTVARIGGDEFVVLLTDLGEDAGKAASEAQKTAQTLLTSLSQPYDLQGHAYSCTGSIGIAIADSAGASIEDLLRQADLAMYHAKSAGRNMTSFYDARMQEILNDRIALEADLRPALEKKEFELHYQPQTDSQGRLTGAEALIRWRHPVRGLVSPLTFIPIAEDTRLIVPIGLWVLRTACTQLVSWSARKETCALTLAVNVSAYQFRQQNFVQQVREVIDQTGANPRLVKLELTESMLVDNIEDVILKMRELRATGVGFSLDDFGTGYSSLSYLKRLPLDQLKIDRAFVNDVLTSENDASIAISIINLGQSLGLHVIAEGVETAAQRDFLLAHHCYAFQGYFFSKPLPIAEFDIYARAFSAH